MTDNYSGARIYENSMAKIDRRIGELLNVTTGSRYYGQVVSNFLDGCTDLYIRELNEHRRSAHLDYIIKALRDRITETTARREHTIRGLSAAEHMRRSLHDLAHSEHEITKETMKRELGLEKYYNYLDERVLAEIVEQREIARENRRMWVKRANTADEKIDELEYELHSVGYLMRTMIANEVNDAKNCERLFEMEQENRERMFRWQGFTRR